MDIKDVTEQNQVNEMTAEELDAYLAGGTKVEEADDKGDSKDKEPAPATPPKVEKPEEDKEEDKKEDEVEYKSVVHFLNDEFKLGLNIASLPEEISLNQEAEMVAEVFRRLQTGVERKLSQYQEVDNILKDEEVREFIRAKQEGKTLRDYVQQYASSAQGLPSDVVAAKYLKNMNPSMEDADVQELLNNYKEKGKLDKLETDARKYFQESDLREAKLKEQQLAEEAKTIQIEREKDILNFNQYVRNIKDISGVPVDDKMKQEIFIASTQVGKDGLTWLDKALQTDEGMFMAAAGILHMKKLVGGKQTTEVNKRNQKFMETLFDTPDQLQSGSSGGNNREFDASIANQF